MNRYDGTNQTNLSRQRFRRPLAGAHKGSSSDRTCCALDTTGPNERLLGQTDQDKKEATLSVTVDAVVRKLNYVRATMHFPADVDPADCDWS